MNKEMLAKIFNIGSHVGVGVWSGNGLNDPRYRWGTLVLSAGFLAYQTLGAWRKGDEGYVEVKEYLIGLGGILAYKRFMDWWETRETEVEQD